MSQSKRIIVVGGVAGGASAAARARRLCEDAEIIMFERGEYISFANCGLPYHIGGVIEERERLLVQTPAAMKQRFGIDVRTRTEVVEIDPSRKRVLVRLPDGSTASETYDALVLSPGAEPLRPPIAGADSAKVHTLRTMDDMDAIKKAVDSGSAKTAVVVGGGYIGLEMAEALIERKLKVSLVELEAQVFGAIDAEMAAPLHQQLRLYGVDLRLATSVTAFRERDESLTAELSSGEHLNCDIAIMAVGVRPEVKLARDAGLKIGERGGILVDEHMRTSDPDIYAVGDAVEVTDFVGGFPSLVPLAGPANRQGRIAADNIFGRSSTYRKTQGTAICKVFDLAVAMTGLSEKACKRNNIACEKIYIHPANHAGYYPGAAQMSLKLIFEPQTGRILGAQAVGPRGVDKRIDVLAVAIRAGLNVRDMQDLELSYAPPYGSAKDPVNYAGFVASNVLDGLADICHGPDVIDPGTDKMLIDTRTPEEVHAGTIPGAVNIPVDELRNRLGELPGDKELLVFCQVGLRGYLACRMLAQHGFKCRNLSGGYKTYLHYTGAGEAEDVQKELSSDTGEKGAAAASDVVPQVVKHIDATGLQCPGPIMKLRAELENLSRGQAVTITSSDPGFFADIEGWCHSTGNRLISAGPQQGLYAATVAKGSPIHETADPKHKTIVIFSNDFDKAMAAFIIANGAAAMGSDVTLFFTFWGLNLLRRAAAVPVTKTPVERMFGWMMPRGAGKTKLSKMNMAGMGAWMIRSIMRKKQVLSLQELIDKARENNVRLVACAMSMDLMGIKKEELIDGVQTGGVAMYLDKAESSGVNLFI